MPNFAYDAATQFDPAREYLLLLSARSTPTCTTRSRRARTYDFNALHNRYFTINGRAFPDTIQDNGSTLLPNQPYGSLVRIQPNTAANPQPALIRMINAGPLEPSVPPARQPHAADRPGRPAAVSRRREPATTEHFGETIGAGQTQDYLLRWDTDDQDSTTLEPDHATRSRWRRRTTAT